MTTTSTIPARAELVTRAADLVPLLRSRAQWADENRRLADDVVEAMADAGIFRMRLPRRFGGYECDARTMVEVAMHLGRGDSATAFTVAVWWITSWNLGLFPDEAQDEVFSTPDVRVCGTLAPTGTAQPVDGGIQVTGRWGFNSGAAHSQWKLLSALLPTADGGMEPIMAVVPVGDVELVDDWQVGGLRGTGSVTALAQDLFIPAHRYVRIGPLLGQQYYSTLNADLRLYRAPMIAAISAATVGKMVGVAKGALEGFFERLPGRAITYTSYDSQREAPYTHLQVAEASLKIDEAEYHAYRLADMVDGKSDADEPWTLQERAYARVAVGRVCQLAKEATDIVALASGGSSIYSQVPIQRLQRDIQAMALHALNLPSNNLELYGRVLCGLEPNSPFV
ncbi:MULTISPECIES: acyl-CoA dehydrogenase family protein [unclassified Solwaraspora]|uniref:acyl-CoA dehydrogenase family protein n=1 Tax=unclassified Solwaraspora TaxID=2627926 RepID=UPI00259AF4B0|nr:acyl-CoA dehydrogenase family protein [Solwaraspora sp. WMMA2056]WJK38627.1 acyl-CoA dehydrogenase family protein [Solwaraspora sp. WMMA2056]